jgi:hypothetical protein
MTECDRVSVVLSLDGRAWRVLTHFMKDSDESDPSDAVRAIDAERRALRAALTHVVNAANFEGLNVVDNNEVLGAIEDAEKLLDAPRKKR